MTNRKKKTSTIETKPTIVGDEKYYIKDIKRDWCNLKSEFTTSKKCNKCKETCVNAGEFVPPSHLIPKDIRIGVPSRFTLSFDEQKNASRFIEEHAKRHGEIDISYIFTANNGIGTGLTIKCNICGEEQDITDYKNW